MTPTWGIVKRNAKKSHLAEQQYNNNIIFIFLTEKFFWGSDFLIQE